MFDSCVRYADMVAFAEAALAVEGKAIISFPCTAKAIAEKWAEEYRLGICRSLWGVRPVDGQPLLYEAYKIV